MYYKRVFNMFLFAFALTFICCSGQTSPPSEIYNEDFKWKITVPENFENVSAEQWVKMQNRGEEAIENTYGEEVINQSKTLFVFKSDQLNYFESNYQPFDEAIDGNYLESSKAVNQILYETFIAQIPGVKIDTATSVEKIDELEFQTCTMKITYPNKMVMNFIMYSRLFDKKELTVNIMYVDAEKGKLMKDSWYSSNFLK